MKLISTLLKRRFVKAPKLKTKLLLMAFLLVSLDLCGQTSIPSQLTFDLNAPDYRSWNVSVKSGEEMTLTGHLDVPSSYTGRADDNILRTFPVTVIWNLSSNISSVYIPNSITRIEDNGFATSTKLKSIVIPNSVNSVGVFAFKGCTALKSVVISPNNKCSSSFSGCDIKKGAYPAGNRAFVADIEVAYPAYCIPDSAGLVFDSTMSEFYFAPWDIQYLELPETVTYMGPKALAGCTKIRNLSVRATTPPAVENDTFDGAVISVLEVPLGCKEAYEKAPGWSKFASIIVESEPTITIRPENISLKQGDTAQLYVYLGNSLTSDGNIEWSSSDNSIANVDENGKVAAISTGTAIISASYGSLIATAMVTVVPDQVVESGIKVNGLYFSLHDTPAHEAHLVRPLSGVYEETSYYVPEKITFAGVEYVVTEIEERAFFKDFAHIIPLQKIYLPSSIVEIGESAFEGCYDLQTVEIPSESVLSIINKKAFKSCKSLKNFKLPDNIEFISGEVFSECENLEDIYFGRSLRMIGYSCFDGCAKLSKINIPSTVEEIEGCAFQDCSSLYEVTMEDSVISIGMSAFKNCSALQKITLSNALGIIDEELFSGCTALKEIKIPDSVRQISMRAFSGCVNLENVIVPFSGEIKSLGYLTFENCSNLRSFIIPPSCSVYKGGFMDTFRGCSGLIKAAYPSKLGGNPFPSGVAIEYDSDSAILENDVIWSKDKSTIYYAALDFTGEIPCPATLTKINDYAFYKCSLSDCDTLVIGKNVGYIGENAFADCGTIGHLIIQEGEVSVNIGEYAFYGVPIQDIYLGRNFINNSYSYEAKPFSSNGCLERLVIGPKVTLIGSRSFAKCQNLKEVIIEDSSKTLEFRYGDCVFGESPFETLYLGRNIYFDEMYYQSDHPFKNNDQLKTLYIGSSVSSLGTKNFGNCVSLQNIFILDGNSQLIIEDDILKKLPLRNLQIGRELTYAGNTTLFEKHNSLENVWITDRVKNINSFSNCLSLKTVYLGDAIPTINKNVFLNCADLNFIDIGNGVKEIQVAAFSGCSSLNFIYMHASTPPVLNQDAFDRNIFNQSELHFPSTSAYLSAENWSKFKNTSNNFEIGIGYENVSASSGDIITLEINAVEDVDLESVILLSSNPATAQILDDMNDPTSFYIKNGVRMRTKSVKVKINKAEEVTIAAFTQKGQMAKCIINRGVESPVEIIPAETIILNTTEVILKESENVELVATVMPETATDKIVTWTTSDASVATVDKNGVVSAVGIGVAIITASTSNGLSCECQVQVTDSIDIPVTKIVIENISNGIMYDNLNIRAKDQAQLTFKVLPENATDKTIVYTSSDSLCVSINQSGMIESKKRGSAEITATASNGISTSLRIDVFLTTYKPEVEPYIDNLVSVDGFIYDIDLVEKTATVHGCSDKIKSNPEFRDSIKFVDGEIYPVVRVKQGAFYNNSNLVGELTFPNTISSIEQSAFCECKKLKSLKFGDGLKTIGSLAFAYCTGLEGDLIIPNSVMEIEQCAFSDCSRLNILTLGNSLKKIGDQAFIRCTGFTGDLIIPNSVVTIGKDAFCDCTGFNGKLIISDSVTSTGYASFEGCTGFKTLKIGDSVSDIGDFAFRYCSGFQGELRIPESVVRIGMNAFYGCSGFEGGLRIPDSVEEIKSNAFENCSGITGPLIIGRSVTTVGTDVLKNCTGLINNSSTVISRAIIPPTIKVNDFFNIYWQRSAILFVPLQSVNEYSSDSVWKYFKKIVGVEDMDKDCVIINQKSATLDVQDVLQLSAITYPIPVDDEEILWESSNENVAAVDKDGIVTAKSIGKAVITASSRDLSAQCMVTVSKMSGIDEVVADGEYPIDVYNLQGIGIRVSNANDLKKLSPGIYIINGKKYIVK